MYLGYEGFKMLERATNVRGKYGDKICFSDSPTSHYEIKNIAQLK